MEKITTLIFAFSFAVFAHGQQRFSNEQKELQQAVVNMFQALSDRDSVGLKSFCFPDVTFYEYGKIWNIDSMIRKAIIMNLLAEFKRANTFEFINTEKGQDIAWITYRLSSVIIKDGKESVVEWLETVGLAIHEGRWKVKHLHSTLIKRS